MSDSNRYFYKNIDVKNLINTGTGTPTRTDYINWPRSSSLNNSYTIFNLNNEFPTGSQITIEKPLPFLYKDSSNNDLNTVNVCKKITYSEGNNQNIITESISLKIASTNANFKHFSGYIIGGGGGGGGGGGSLFYKGGTGGDGGTSGYVGAVAIGLNTNESNINIEIGSGGNAGNGGNYSSSNTNGNSGNNGNDGNKSSLSIDANNIIMIANGGTGGQRGGGGKGSSNGNNGSNGTNGNANFTTSFNSVAIGDTNIRVNGSTTIPNDWPQRPIYPVTNQQYGTGGKGGSRGNAIGKGSSGNRGNPGYGEVWLLYKN
jgi:hypothetical protein